MVALAGLAAAAFAFWSFSAKSVERHPLALMTSIPIYWGDGADIGDLVSPSRQKTFVRKVLEQRYDLSPVDTLALQDGLTGDAPKTDPLAGIERLLIVQPRGISPEDNAALDRWVRKGGKLFIALDPLLTNTYSVSIADPRHPSASAQIPAVVRRWGLGMKYDESQPFEAREIEGAGTIVPVMMAGELVPVGEAGAEGRADCEIEPEGIIARCSVGLGSVTVFADAAIFEQVGAEGVGEEAIIALLESAFE